MRLFQYGVRLNGVRISRGSSSTSHFIILQFRILYANHVNHVMQLSYYGYRFAISNYRSLVLSCVLH